MEQRGRKSIAALTLPNPSLAVQRLRPFGHLSDAEQSVWLEIVNDQPADAFTSTHAPLLELYCRHIVQSRVISEEIANFDRAWMADAEGLKRYDKLLAMVEREGRAASSIATRLRITRQAVDQQTIARKLVNHSKSRKPWELALESE